MRRLSSHGAAAALLSLLPALALSPASAADRADDMHLRFFRANRDFILRAFEAQPHGAPVPGAGGRSWSFDPFAPESAARRVAAARAGLDSAATLQDLGAWRAALDSVLGEAGAAAARFDDLDARFAAHLRTAFELTLAARSNVAVERVEAWLDGALVERRSVTDTERAALAAGGVLEVLRRVVEPRAQQLEVRAWTRGRNEPSRTAVLLRPIPDALLTCHLDLESASGPAHIWSGTLGGKP